MRTISVILFLVFMLTGAFSFANKRELSPQAKVLRCAEIIRRELPKITSSRAREKAIVTIAELDAEARQLLPSEKQPKILSKLQYAVLKLVSDSPEFLAAEELSVALRSAPLTMTRKSVTPFRSIRELMDDLRKRGVLKDSYYDPPGRGARNIVNTFENRPQAEGAIETFESVYRYAYKLGQEQRGLKRNTPLNFDSIDEIPTPMQNVVLNLLSEPMNNYALAKRIKTDENFPFTARGINFALEALVDLGLVDVSKPDIYHLYTISEEGEKARHKAFKFVSQRF